MKTPPKSFIEFLMVDAGHVELGRQQILTSYCPVPSENGCDLPCLRSIMWLQLIVASSILVLVWRCDVGPKSAYSQAGEL